MITHNYDFIGDSIAFFANDKFLLRIWFKDRRVTHPEIMKISFQDHQDHQADSLFLEPIGLKASFSKDERPLFHLPIKKPFIDIDRIDKRYIYCCPFCGGNVMQERNLIKGLDVFPVTQCPNCCEYILWMTPNPNPLSHLSYGTSTYNHKVIENLLTAKRLDQVSFGPYDWTVMGFDDKQDSMFLWCNSHFGNYILKENEPLIDLKPIEQELYNSFSLEERRSLMPFKDNKEEDCYITLPNNLVIDFLRAEAERRNLPYNIFDFHTDHLSREEEKPVKYQLGISYRGIDNQLVPVNTVCDDQGHWSSGKNFFYSVYIRPVIKVSRKKIRIDYHNL